MFAPNMMIPHQLNNQKYKTSLCRHFISNGTCQLAYKCQFAHGEQELRNQNDPIPQNATVINPIYLKMQQGSTSNFKTMVCKYFMNGFCKNTQGCTFAHGELELQGNKNMMMGGAQMDYQNQMMMGQQLNYGMQSQYGMQSMQNQGMHGSQYGMGMPGQQMYQQQNFQSVEYQNMARLQAMIYIIEKLRDLFSNDMEALQKLTLAYESVQNNDTQTASNTVTEIMNNPNRTQQQLNQYNIIFQQAQESLMYNNHQSQISAPQGFHQQQLQQQF